MKQFFIPTLAIMLTLILFLLPACKKDKALRQKFAGKWEAENYSGYPFNNNYQAPGNGNIIFLGADGEYERRKFDTVLFKGSFSIEKKDDCSPRENKLAFITNDSSYQYNRYIDIKDGKLLLNSSNCLADGGTAYYRRLE